MTSQTIYVPPLDLLAFGPVQDIQALGDYNLTLYKNPTVIPYMSRNITLTGISNLSGISFVLTGKDIYGLPITETLVGPNATVAYSSNLYHQLTSIYVPAGPWAPNLDVRIGFGTRVTTQPIQLDTFRKQFQASIQVVLDQFTPGDVQYSISKSATNIYKVLGQANQPLTVITAPTWFPVDASLTNATSNQYFYLDSPTTCLKADLEFFAFDTSLTLTIVQEGIK